MVVLHEESRGDTTGRDPHEDMEEAKKELR